MPTLDSVSGPITGLHLPRHVLEGLQRNGVTTIDQLRVMADRLERLDRIGPKTAQLIRDELAHVASSRTVSN